MKYMCVGGSLDGKKVDARGLSDTLCFPKHKNVSFLKILNDPPTIQPMDIEHYDRITDIYDDSEVTVYMLRALVSATVFKPGVRTHLIHLAYTKKLREEDARLQRKREEFERRFRARDPLTEFFKVLGILESFDEEEKEAMGQDYL